MARVAAKGTQVGSMGAVIEVRTGTTDIEHEADLLSRFGEELVHLPVNDNGTVENCRSLCLTVQHFMSGHLCRETSERKNTVEHSCCKT